MYKTKNRKRTIIIITVTVVILVALGGLGFSVWNSHLVQTVYVEGNIHYTEEEIKAIVMDGPLADNSLYLAMKYKNKSIEQIPFIDQMDVTILAPDTIKISVYEKALAGYVKYMDTYVYFDKDGYAVESSAIRTAGIPQVTGLDFDYIVMGQPLPVTEGEEAVFATILELSKLINKYGLTADRIYFHSNGEITVYFGQIKVSLGNESSHLEDKIMCLPNMLPKIEQMSGTLDMSAYKDSGDYSFKPDT